MMNSNTILALIFVIIPTIPALGSLLLTWKNRNRLLSVEDTIIELHVSVNSRLSELIAATSAASHAEGVLKGREETTEILKTLVLPSLPGKS